MLALPFSDKASYRAGGVQGLDRCVTRATGPDQVASSISTAWAALTADVPVLHGAPGGIRSIERLSETPMQYFPEDIADGIHVARAAATAAATAKTQEWVEAGWLFGWR